MDKDGRYVTEWTAIPKETPYQAYAIYEDNYGRILRSVIQTFHVNENLSQIAAQSEGLINGPYIPIKFDDYNKKILNIFVQYDEASTPYESIAERAIKHWSEMLEDRSGNPNAWKFKISKSREPPTSQTEVNILVNLKRENQGECPGWSGGCAHNSD